MKINREIKNEEKILRGLLHGIMIKVGGGVRLEREFHELELQLMKGGLK